MSNMGALIIQHVLNAITCYSRVKTIILEGGSTRYASSRVKLQQWIRLSTLIQSIDGRHLPNRIQNLEDLVSL